MRFILVSLIFMFTIGCSVNPSKIGNSEAKEFAEKITYVKDYRTQLCFALVATRKTGDVNSTGMGITEVPCNDVKYLIQK